MSFPLKRSVWRPRIEKKKLNSYSCFLVDGFSSKKACVTTRRVKILEKILDEFSMICLSMLKCFLVVTMLIVHWKSKETILNSHSTTKIMLLWADVKPLPLWAMERVVTVLANKSMIDLMVLGVVRLMVKRSGIHGSSWSWIYQNFLVLVRSEVCHIFACLVRR